MHALRGQRPAAARGRAAVLTWLSLDNNSIGDQGAIALGKALEVNAVLTTRDGFVFAWLGAALLVDAARCCCCFAALPAIVTLLCSNERRLDHACPR